MHYSLRKYHQLLSQVSISRSRHTVAVLRKTKPKLPLRPHNPRRLAHFFFINSLFSFAGNFNSFSFSVLISPQFPLPALIYSEHSSSSRVLHRFLMDLVLLLFYFRACLYVQCICCFWRLLRESTVYDVCCHFGVQHAAGFSV